MCPLKRLGGPKDVAYIVAFLTIEAGQWTNGRTLTFGGGEAI